MWWMLAGLAQAQTLTATEVGAPRRFGLGAQLGTFSGITGKIYLRNRDTAFDFALGTAYGNQFRNSVHAHVTFHVHFPALTEGQGVTIPWRLGVGGWLNAGSHWFYNNFDRTGVILGARAPVGLDFDLEDVPVQFYVEAALNLSVIPGIAAGLDASLGGRYYF